MVCVWEEYACCLIAKVLSTFLKKLNCKAIENMSLSRLHFWKNGSPWSYSSMLYSRQFLILLKVWNTSHRRVEEEGPFSQADVVWLTSNGTGNLCLCLKQIER